MVNDTHTRRRRRSEGYYILRGHSQASSAAKRFMFSWHISVHALMAVLLFGNLLFAFAILWMHPNLAGDSDSWTPCLSHDIPSQDESSVGSAYHAYNTGTISPSCHEPSGNCPGISYCMECGHPASCTGPL